MFTKPKANPFKRVALLAAAFLIVYLIFGDGCEDTSISLLKSNENTQLPSSFSWDKIEPSRDLEWHDCYTKLQCARFIVPLNYSEPHAATAVIALARKPSPLSGNSDKYKGPVLFNPGGPGGSGVETVLNNAELFQTILGPQFDIVSFDPRGTSRSTPRASVFHSDAERAMWTGAGLRVVNTSDEGIARAWAEAKIFGQLAHETDDGYLNHINTDNTARDMLEIVKAHGREKIQYWGFSYGSVLGATFASMFPDKIERMIIDGVVDAENYFATLWSNNLMDTRKVMNSFFDGCAEAGPDRCPFYAPTPEQISQNLTKLYESLRSVPIPVRTSTSYGLLDYNRFKSTIFRSLYKPYASFSPLAQGLADLAAGNATTIFQILETPVFKCSCEPVDYLSGPIIEGHVAIACNDGKEVPSSLEEAEKYFKMLAEASEWADVWGSIRLSCSGWPKMPKKHFQGPFLGNTSHPLLLIGNTADPVTPLWAAKKMSNFFKGSVVLTQDSAGHCSTSSPSLCTQKYVRDYFVNGTLPEPGTICPMTGSIFPTKSLELPGLEDQITFSESMTEEDRSILQAAHSLSITFSPGVFLN